MNHIYCDLCHLSINVPQKHFELFEEINKEIKYLHSLDKSRYQLDHLMSGRTKPQIYLDTYNYLIERIESEDRSFFDFKKKTLKMNKDHAFRHQFPTMINLQRCMNDIDISTLNELYCPAHFGDFLNQIEVFKATTNELKNEIEILNQLLSCQGRICSISFLELFQIIKITQVFATHVLEKRLFLFQKIDKLVLKHTLESLRGDFRIPSIAEDFKQLFSKNLNNRDDNKINYFKSFQEIKPSVISPKEFTVSSVKGIKKEIYEILLINDRDSAFYTRSSILNYEGHVGKSGHLFSCRQGYFWVNKDQAKISAISKSFFVDRNDCINDFNNDRNNVSL